MERNLSELFRMWIGTYIIPWVLTGSWCSVIRGCDDRYLGWVEWAVEWRDWWETVIEVGQGHGGVILLSSLK